MIRLQSIRYVDDVETYTTYEELMQLMTRINLDVNIRGDDHKGDPPLAPQLSYREVFHKRAPYSSSDLRRRVYEAEKKLRER